MGVGFVELHNQGPCGVPNDEEWFTLLVNQESAIVCRLQRELSGRRR